MKGVFLRQNILCDTIPPPPPGANAKPPELGPGMTTRESVEALTEMPGTVCAGCHSTAINPLGFATEGFDALGRFRTSSACSTPPARRPARSRSTPTSRPAGRRRRHDADSTPAELMSLIVASGKVEACLSRNYFRFTYAPLGGRRAPTAARSKTRARRWRAAASSPTCCRGGEGRRSSSGATFQ